MITGIAKPSGMKSTAAPNAGAAGTGNQLKEINMRTLELYYNDLTPEAQAKYLKVHGVSNASELNWEINPVAIIEIEDEGFCGDDPSTITGSFVSVWDEGTIQTEGTLNLRTGQVTAKSVEPKDLGSLEREYFEDKNGKEYEICTDCHEYILKITMRPDPVGKGLTEVTICSDPNCE
jgi:hypothetical protein